MKTIQIHYSQLIQSRMYIVICMHVLGVRRGRQKARFAVFVVVVIIIKKRRKVIYNMLRTLDLVVFVATTMTMKALKCKPSAQYAHANFNTMHIVVSGTRLCTCVHACMTTSTMYHVNEYVWRHDVDHIHVTWPLYMIYKEWGLLRSPYSLFCHNN